MHKTLSQRLRARYRNISLWVKCVVLTLGSLLPSFLSPSLVSAAPALQERELQSTTSKVSTDTTLTWIFDTTADAGNADHIEIEFCDAPLGTCTTTNTPAIDASSLTATLNANWTSTGNSASRTNGDNGGSNNQILIDKTTADNASGEDELSIAMAADDIANNATANRTYYTRMRIYSDTGTTLEWEGVFAQSTAEQLTVNARVQERLDFCVGTTTVDDATTSPGATCTNISGNTVDIGIIDPGAVNVSPVGSGSGGNTTNGIAMVRSNAFNGTVVSYFAQQESSTGRLKVTGASCTSDGSGFDTGSSSTDQCFDSTATQGTLTSGTEQFGMTIAGVNCGSTTAYTCTFSSGTYNLVRNASYDGGGSNTYVVDSGVTTTTTNGYAWQSSGATTTIASSASSSTKVIDDEALILKFAATAGVTTPTGQYTVVSTYIATATY